MGQVREVLVGAFAFHLLHNHWHVENFAKYELRNAAGDGSIGGTVYRSGQKTTFCTIDTEKSRPRDGARGDADLHDVRCARHAGVVGGTGRRVRPPAGGHGIDVTNLPDGTYWLVSTAGWQDRILETDDSNHAAAAKIAISGSQVQAVP